MGEALFYNRFITEEELIEWKEDYEVIDMGMSWFNDGYKLFVAKTEEDEEINLYVKSI